MGIVFVTGAVGSGKSHWARRLGSAAGVPVVELDAIYLELPVRGTQRTTKPADERDRELAAALDTETAIFEGWHFGEWLVPLYRRLAAAVVLDVPAEVCEARVRARHRARKAGDEHDPFPLSDDAHLENLLRWTRRFDAAATVDEIRAHAPTLCEVVVTTAPADELVLPHLPTFPRRPTG